MTIVQTAAQPVAPRFYKRRVPDSEPITSSSTSLFRFGEQCNYRCPMCSNTGDPSLFFHSTAELLRRAALLRDLGFKRAMVTGGEPSIHPGFWTVVERLAEYGMEWDINTHGRSFAAPDFARQSVATGLRRAIVSLHSLEPSTGAAIFGVNERAYAESIEGVHRMVDAGVDVMLNCVLTRLNLTQLESYLPQAQRLFGGAVRYKFVFPTTIGKGGQWPAISSLRYDDVREPIRRVRRLATELGADVYFESFPNCVLGDPGAVNLGRSAFGESHYLDDASGNCVYSMRYIEADLSAFGEVCAGCAAVATCPGLARTYVKRFGVGELAAFPAVARAGAALDRDDEGG